MKPLSLLMAATLLAAPLLTKAQTTVFQDTFPASNKSTLNPTAASPGPLTATRTAYEIASSKTASATTLGTGALTLSTSATTSGYTEAQALFTATPVTLNAAGQYIEVYYTFTDTANLFNGSSTNNAQVNIGLYNSGGSAPTNGTLLWGGGLASSSSTAATGGTQNWLGYNAQFAYSKAAAQPCAIGTRPAQTGANNLNQAIGIGSGYSGNVNVTTYAGVIGEPLLSAGNQYTLHLRIAYVNSTTLAITNTLYDGVGIGGTVHSANGFTARFGGTASSAITFTFDAFEVGYRPTANPSTATTLPINNITVAAYIPAVATITGLINQTVIQGNDTTLAAAVTGTPAPGLQWYYSSDGGISSNGIPGETAATLSLNNVQYSQDGYIYYLVATNSQGTTVSNLTLSVIVPPGIAGLSDQAVSTGNTVNISPTVSGVPTPALQWQYNGVAVSDGATVNGSTISGSTTSSLSIANAQDADSGTYSLVASNSAGMVTNSMYLTVGSGNVAPIVTGPTNLTVIQGNNGTFSAIVSGLPLPTLQWLDQTGNPIPDATNSSLTISNVQYSQNGYVYSLIASNSVASKTNSATLTVIVPPTISSQPSSLTVTNPQSASFTVIAAGVPDPTYQWYKNGSPISSGANNTATNATLVLSTTAPADSGSTYFVLVSNAAGSTNSVTNTLTVVSSMGIAALSPANNATGICYDTPLYLTFSQTPTLKNAGTIKIYNVNNSATPVDTIDLSLNINNNSTYAKNVQPYVIGGDTFTNYPVIITGNQAAIYLHRGVLTSNQTYYVTLDAGTFTDSAGANFAGITATNLWQFTTKVGGPANPTNLLVTADGSGDFLTVQGAVDSVPAGNTTPTVINIRNGNYVELVNIKSKHNLTLRGQSRDGTIVGYGNNNWMTAGTHYRMSTKINANDIAFDNLTLTNRTPAGGSQAEALMLESNVKRFILNNCTLGSFQDTFLANGGGQAQAYLNNSLVIGQFDYMWGGGAVFVTNCQMLTVYGTGGAWNLIATRTDNSAAGTWPGYNGLSSSNGFAFVNCFINKQTGAGIGSPTLADSNGSTNGVAAFINCQIQKDYVAPAAGVINSEILWEYGNTTNGVAVNYGFAAGAYSAPAITGTSDPRYLAASSATNWLYGWVPELAPNILTNPVSQTVNDASPATFTVAATGIPDPTYQWQHAGTNLDAATGSSLTIANATADNAGNYVVIVTTSAGSVTSSVATLTVNPPSNTAPVFSSSIADTNINVGFSLSIASPATDSDTPAQTLTYTLLTGPSGAAVDSSTGTFSWRPTTSQANTVNAVKIVVTDDGTPNLTATNSFTVTVNALTAPTAGTASYAGGMFSVSVSGQLGPDYALQARTNLTSGDWTTVATTNAPAAMPVILADPGAGSQPVQFYRIVTGPPLP